MRAGPECCYFLCSHGVPWRQRTVRFATARARPAAVRGPVLRPPCNLQRPLLLRSRRRQCLPALVLAPHASPRAASGNSGHWMSAGFSESPAPSTAECSPRRRISRHHLTYCARGAALALLSRPAATLPGAASPVWIDNRCDITQLIPSTTRCMVVGGTSVTGIGHYPRPRAHAHAEGSPVLESMAVGADRALRTLLVERSPDAWQLLRGSPLPR